MSAFKAGDRVKYAIPNGYRRVVLLDKPKEQFEDEDNWWARDTESGEKILVENDLISLDPLAPFEPLLSHYTDLCRISMAMGGKEGPRFFLFQEFRLMDMDIEGANAVCDLIMARAQKDFTYSDEQRDALLAAIREETERARG